jgi:predicted small lipoprotein YifL
MLRDFSDWFRRAAIGLAMAAAGIAPLTACGVKGPLKLPSPPAAAAGAPASDPAATGGTAPPAAPSAQPAERKP